jgi:hypothetical protein
LRSEILTAASLKNAVFWVVSPCSLVEIDVSVPASIIIALMMEAASTSETSVNVYQTTRRDNPQDSHLREPYCSYEGRFIK